MGRTLYSSIASMIAPETIGTITGRVVRAVRCRPFSSADSLSGSRFVSVETDDGTGGRFVLKRIRAEWDWSMRATDDRDGREVTVWQDGLLDRLPPEVTHAVVACAADGPGWAILLRDVSACLFPAGDRRISARDNEQLLDAMTALHAAFWDVRDPASLSASFCPLRLLYTFLSLGTARRELTDPAPVPRQIVEGWGLFRSLVPSDVADLVLGLADDPSVLCEALARFPRTVVHGDWKLGNLGLLDDSRRARAVVLDWARVAVAPPAVDLAWYLAVNSTRLPVPKEAAIASYKGSLEGRLGARFDERRWRPQLELALLGGLVQLGWSKALGAARGESEAVRARERMELAWWSEWALAGRRWL